MKIVPRLSCLVLSLLVAHALGHAVRADVRLPGVFSDHMVLQRDIRIPVWGWSDPGEQISVGLGEQEKTATADNSGAWSVRLDAVSAGGPFELIVSGKNRLVVSDVLVGEVWLCSGQSNMAMTVSRARDFDAEKKSADYPEIRMFKTSSHAIPEPQADCQGAWTPCGSETVGDFSATAYFFGRKLHQELGVPIGLINSSWGGTDVAAWTSLSAQASVDQIVPKLDEYAKVIENYDPEAASARHEKALETWKRRAARAKEAGNRVPRRPRAPVDPRVNQNRPANLFNGMIHPLIPYAIRGAIWYQGERNSKTIPDGMLYATQLKTLITDWRSRWGQGDFPFLTVQLPNFRARQTAPVQTTGWVMVRESESKTLRLPNTGLAVTTDVGEEKDIHPKDKQTVGLRLALWALGTTYEKDILYSGPLFTSCQIRDGRVNAKGKARPGAVTAYFEHVGDGLKTRDGGPPKGFAVAGEDRRFFAASVRLKPDGTIDVSSDKVPAPVAVRYNWAENPDGNLVNSAGLPAAPFRTDRWSVLQEKEPVEE